MFKRKRSAEDFAEEVRAHLELEADELHADGLSSEEARRRAHVTGHDDERKSPEPSRSPRSGNDPLSPRPRGPVRRADRIHSRWVCGTWRR